MNNTRERETTCVPSSRNPHAQLDVAISGHRELRLIREQQSVFDDQPVIPLDLQARSHVGFLIRRTRAERMRSMRRERTRGSKAL